MIELENVTKKYVMGTTEIYALHDVSLTIERGEFLSIMGPSGSGKTTILNLISCLDKPTSGVVRIDSVDISRLKEKSLSKLRLRKIGHIFQQFYLIPTLTALENIVLPMKEARVPRKERKSKATSLLSQVGLSERASHYPAQLSGGEQQRVAIARALANAPEVLLADEPTGEVDTRTGHRIIDLVTSLNHEKNITVVLVTHDPGIGEHAKRRVMLKDGKIYGVG